MQLAAPDESIRTVQVRWELEAQLKQMTRIGSTGACWMVEEDGIGLFSRGLPGREWMTPEVVAF
jgi:hypothetical protein